MARPGRKPKPPELRLLEGNREHRPINTSAPQHQPVLTKAPKHLGRYGRAEWDRLAPILHSRYLLTDAYLGTFEALCQAYQDWRVNQADVEKNGYYFLTETGYEQKRPAASIAAQSRKDYVSFGVEFGLSPSSNGRLTIPIADGDEVDPMEAALGG